MKELPCYYCKKATPIDQVGSEYSPDSQTPDGELDEENVVCALCMAGLDVWIESQVKADDASNGSSE